MKESDFKTKLVAAINKMEGGYAQRIEDKFAVGVLDMLIKFPGRPIVFAEGKLIPGRVFGPTPSQYQRGLRAMAADIPAILIGWKAGAIYLSEWTQQATIGECFSGEGPQAAILLAFLEERIWKVR
jgi:hypothetical protein